MMRKTKTLMILFSVLSAAALLAVPAGYAADAKQMPVKQTWGRDPFTAAELDMITIDTVVDSDEAAPPVERFETHYQLTGILTRGDRQVAIINGQLVRENDEIEGSKVLKIESDQVVLERNSKEQVLRMGIA